MREVGRRRGLVLLIFILMNFKASVGLQGSGSGQRCLGLRGGAKFVPSCSVRPRTRKTKTTTMLKQREKHEHKASRKRLHEIDKMAPPIDPDDDEQENQIGKPAKKLLKQRKKWSLSDRGGRISLRQARSMKGLRFLKTINKTSQARKKWLEGARKPREARVIPGEGGEERSGDGAAQESSVEGAPRKDRSRMVDPAPAAGSCRPVGRKETSGKNDAKNGLKESLKVKTGKKSKSEDMYSDLTFFSSPFWNGPRSGFAYKKGPKGLGYYRDAWLMRKKKLQEKRNIRAKEGAKK